MLTRLDLPDQIAYAVERIRYAFDDIVPENPEFPVRTGLIGLSSPSDRVTGR